MNDSQCRYDQFILIFVSLPRTNTADALRCIKAPLRCCDTWTVRARKCTQDRTSVRYGSFDHPPHPSERFNREELDEYQRYPTANTRLCRTLTHMRDMQEQVGQNMGTATGIDVFPCPQCLKGRFWTQFFSHLYSSVLYNERCIPRIITSCMLRPTREGHQRTRCRMSR